MLRDFFKKYDVYNEEAAQSPSNALLRNITLQSLPIMVEWIICLIRNEVITVQYITRSTSWLLIWHVDIIRASIECEPTYTRPQWCVYSSCLHGTLTSRETHRSGLGATSTAYLYDTPGHHIRWRSRRTCDYIQHTGVTTLTGNIGRYLYFLLACSSEVCLKSTSALTVSKFI